MLRVSLGHAQATNIYELIRVYEVILFIQLITYQDKLINKEHRILQLHFM